MPYRMHSEYLRNLFLDNDLAEGRYQAGGKPVALTDIRAPIFAVGTLRDHVAPWRSAYKIHLLTNTEVTFLLASGGHNAGIVSEPGHNGRSYQVMTKTSQDRYSDPDEWAASTPTKCGFVVAGMDRVARRALRRARGPAADGRCGRSRRRSTITHPEPTCCRISRPMSRSIACRRWPPARGRLGAAGLDFSRQRRSARGLCQDQRPHRGRARRHRDEVCRPAQDGAGQGGRHRHRRAGAGRARYGRARGPAQGGARRRRGRRSSSSIRRIALVAQRKSELTLAKLQLERSLGLVAKGFTPQETVDQRAVGEAHGGGRGQCRQRAGRRRQGRPSRRPRRASTGSTSTSTTARSTRREAGASSTGSRCRARCWPPAGAC